MRVFAGVAQSFRPRSAGAAAAGVLLGLLLVAAGVGWAAVALGIAAMGGVLGHALAKARAVHNVELEREIDRLGTELRGLKQDLRLARAMQQARRWPVGGTPPPRRPPPTTRNMGRAEPWPPDGDMDE